MCLVAFAWKSHPRWRLVLAGNRDEFHLRPSAALAKWDAVPPMLAGRDLEAGGIWLGVGPGGRAGVVTNVRDPAADQNRATRGNLALEFLRNSQSAEEFAARLRGRAALYRPFNLLLFDANSAVVVSNHPESIAQAVAPGIHALSNGAPGEAWPKMQRLETRLREWIGADRGDPEPLLEALADETVAADDDLPHTGVGLEAERRLSPAFIRGEKYGTRASTILLIDHDGGGWIFERRFGPMGMFQGEAGFAFEALAPTA